MCQINNYYISNYQLLTNLHSATANVLLPDHLHFLMKHFYPGGSGLFWDDPTYLHRVQGLTEWIEEDENDLHNTLWP